MTLVRDFAARHPQVVDACLVVVLAPGIALATVPRDVVDVALLVAVLLPLVWRRRVPVVVFWTVLGEALLAWTLLGRSDGYLLLVVAVAVGTVAERRPRWLVAAVAAVAAVLGAAVLSGDMTLPQLGAVAAVFATAVLAGAQLRTRRAYLAGLEERAARLERERDQQGRLAVAAERSRIAQETHDIVAHNVAVMVALADGAALTTDATPPRVREALTTISATGRQALGEMQHLVGVLKDGSSRQPQPGLADLDALVARVRDAGLRVRLTSEGTPGDWGPSGELAVYRIVQEALTNALEHAAPGADTEVRLSYTTTSADIAVTDDGGGRASPPGTPGKGHGITGMAERAAAFDGRLDAGPREGTGWQVLARLRFAGARETA